MPKSTHHLGRNPFGNKKTPRKVKEVRVEKIETPRVPERIKLKIADWILVTVPAESYLLRLKTMMLTKEILNR